jgi:uncharacterized glyoxalase superfamily protein PhnB
MTQLTSKPAPKDWPRLSSGVFYEDGGAAIDWLCRVFGFELRLKIEGDGGVIEHSELTFGESLLMVGSVGAGHRPKTHCKSPRQLGGANTQCIMLFVDDADAHCAMAKAAGAKIISEPQTTDYGPEYWADRTYEVEDLEGHHWWFVERVRNRGE